MLILGGAIILCVVLFAYAAGYFGRSKKPAHPAIDRIISSKSSPNQALSLVVEPDDGTASVVAFIDGAKSSVDMVMYSLYDRDVESALARAEKRGVSVRVILNGGYQGAPPSKKSLAALARLKALGVPAQFSKPYFDLTHQKSIVADGARALIMTGNLDRTYYKKDRDFQVLDADPADAAAIGTAFESDWEGKRSVAPDGTDLIWSPGSEEEIASVIGSAKHSLLVYNEEMNDVDIEDALEDAARRGVDVGVLMSMDTGWLSAFSALTAAGVHVRTFDAKASTYVHAKIVLSDGKLAFLGSENFSDGSLDANRELGIVLTEPAVIAGLVSVFISDWKQATVFL